MGLPVDTMKARSKDKNGPCISGSDIRDAMGKASGDRHLALFVFTVYRLILFPKALGYVSVDYSLLMVLSLCGYDQCVPAIVGLNRLEALV
ncbi:hypothetical protein Goshw_015319 [Gossypium schwendimanii]|uniref:Uncharacterized protein n=1 Tax=Gossypium schwendimanii TaxID=34291 RepID=A0A7J9MT64_GOSSC|nr:hypothetical protein [Gossypium schwendimanii]